MSERTVRIFDNEPYIKEYTGDIVSCLQRDIYYETVLDATIFFPEQGGQSPDRGLLGGKRVVDVKNRDGVIVHVTEDKPDNGTCELDWEHRFSNMQQHTGEHIFSGITRRRFGYENVGFHLSDHVVTLDTSGPLTREELILIEDEANKVITENHPVRCFYPDPAELDRYDYRSKTGIEGEVRLVEIKDTDLCACCAPHVKTTGEIGLLKVTDFQSYKGGTRISILCGKRALGLFRRDEELLSLLSADLSCKREDIKEYIEKIKKERSDTAAALREAETENIGYKLKDIPVDITSPILFTSMDDNLVIRNTVNAMTERYGGFCGVFYGKGDQYNFIIGSRASDCNEVMKILREEGAKGGGSAKMVQGAISLSEDRIRKIWERIR